MFRLPVREFTPGERLLLHFIGWDVDEHGRRVYMTQRRLVTLSGFQPEKITQTLKKAERLGRLELARRGGRIVDWRVPPIACGKVGGKAVETLADSPAGSLSTIDDRRSSDRGLVDPTIDKNPLTLTFDEGLPAPPSFDPSLDPSGATEASLRDASLSSSQPPTPNPIDDEAERRAALERMRLHMARVDEATRPTTKRRRFQS